MSSEPLRVWAGAVAGLDVHDRTSRLSLSPIVRAAVDDRAPRPELDARYGSLRTGYRLTDIADALRRQGVRKLLLLNGHGGNELKPLTRELHHRTDMFLGVCDWYRVAADQYPKLFEQPGEHADEVETSLGLAFFPHLLKPELADAA